MRLKKLQLDFLTGGHIKEQSDSIKENDNIIVKDEICYSRFKEKEIKHKKYIEVLTDFLNEHYEYTPCYYINKNDLIKDYNDYISKSDKVKNFNGLFGLILKDIPLINNQYIYKDINYCKSCHNKYFKNCCDNYKPNGKKRENSYRIKCILNIKKKVIIPSETMV